MWCASTSVAMTWLCSSVSRGRRASRSASRCASSSFLRWIRSFFLCTSSSVRMTEGRGREEGKEGGGRKEEGQFKNGIRPTGGHRAALRSLSGERERARVTGAPPSKRFHPLAARAGLAPGADVFRIAMTVIAARRGVARGGGEEGGAEPVHMETPGARDN